jgi:sulfoxide reductase heme-binding subunit YedZ
MSVLAAAGPSAYWYLARGTGAVSLVLLTASVVLGVMGSVRFALAPRWPRFAIDTIHRDVSLLVLAVLVVHIVTSVLDSFAPITLTQAVIPFIGTYRPLWLGFGALSFDLLVALALTSILRRRIGYRVWRGIHWLAYASWPVAVLHGLGTGSDTKVWWMLALTVGCVAAVAVAVLIRIARTETEPDGRRGALTALTIATPVGLALFTLAGPLQHGWAARAGTPASLLAKFRPAAARTASAAAAGAANNSPAANPAKLTLKVPFQAQISGNVSQTEATGGALVDLALKLSGGARGKLRIRLAGTPIDGGGLSMTGSQVDLLASGLPSVMEGRIVSLEGQQFVARVTGAGSALELHANLSIDQSSGAVTGTLSGTRSRGGG